VFNFKLHEQSLWMWCLHLKTMWMEIEDWTAYNDPEMAHNNTLTIISHDAKLMEYIMEWCLSRWKTHVRSIAQTAINNEPQVSRKHIHANPLETREIAPTWHQLVVELRFTFSTKNCSIWSVFQLSILHSFSTCRNKQELRYQGNITSSISHIDLTTSHSDGQRSSSCCHNCRCYSSRMDLCHPYLLISYLHLITKKRLQAS